MKKALFLYAALLISFCSAGQIKIGSLPVTTTGNFYDLVIKNDSANGTGATHICTIKTLWQQIDSLGTGRFIQMLSPTGRMVNSYLYESLNDVVIPANHYYTGVDGRASMIDLNYGTDGILAVDTGDAANGMRFLDYSSAGITLYALQLGPINISGGMVHVTSGGSGMIFQDYSTFSQGMAFYCDSNTITFKGKNIKHYPGYGSTGWYEPTTNPTVYQVPAYYNIGTTEQWMNADVIVAHADSSSRTKAVSSLVTWTSTGTHTYRIGGTISITAASSASLQAQVTYKDENNTTQTINLTSTLSSTGAYSLTTSDIRCIDGQTITVKTTFSGTSITYDVGASIEFLY